MANWFGNSDKPKETPKPKAEKQKPTSHRSKDIRPAKDNGHKPKHGK